MHNNTQQLPRLAVIYDHDCPACSFYIQILNIEKNITDMVMINARDSTHPLVQKVHNQGLDLNEGFVLVVDNQLYHGADAIHRLSQLGHHSTIVSTINYWIFRSSRLSRWLYPVLTWGRKLLLRLLGKQEIT